MVEDDSNMPTSHSTTELKEQRKLVASSRPTPRNNQKTNENQPYFEPLKADKHEALQAAITFKI